MQAEAHDSKKHFHLNIKGKIMAVSHIRFNSKFILRKQGYVELHLQV